MDVDRLVEEVARALARQEIDMMCERDGDNGAALWAERKYGSLDGYVDFRWPAFNASARSAILATLRGVREPDDGMMDAGDSIAVPEEGYHPGSGPTWFFMIDHLIKTVEGQ